MGFEIEKGVKIPPWPAGERRNRRQYPFREMEVGDSFFCPGDAGGVASVRVSAHGYQQRNGGAFLIRAEEKSGVSGVRVWRIE